MMTQAPLAAASEAIFAMLSTFAGLDSLTSFVPAKISTTEGW